MRLCDVYNRANLHTYKCTNLQMYNDTNIYKYIQICTDIYEYIQIYTNVYEYIQIYANIQIYKVTPMCRNFFRGGGDKKSDICRTRNGDTSEADPKFAADVSPSRALCNVIRAVSKDEVSIFLAHVRMYIFMATPLRAIFPLGGPPYSRSAGSIRRKEMKEDRNNAE